VLTCSAHEWQYDARTGRGLNPANVTLPRYPVEVRNAEIWIDCDATE
jgi:toluene monooxygenase system ferredoxin subunit